MDVHGDDMYVYSYAIEDCKSYVWDIRRQKAEENIME